MVMFVRTQAMSARWILCGTRPRRRSNRPRWLDGSRPGYASVFTPGEEIQPFREGERDGSRADARLSRRMVRHGPRPPRALLRGLRVPGPRVRPRRPRTTNGILRKKREPRSLERGAPSRGLEETRRRARTTRPYAGRDRQRNPRLQRFAQRPMAVSIRVYRFLKTRISISSFQSPIRTIDHCSEEPRDRDARVRALEIVLASRLVSTTLSRNSSRSLQNSFAFVSGDGVRKIFDASSPASQRQYRFRILR